MPTSEQSQLTLADEVYEYNKAVVMVGTPCYGGLLHEAYMHSFLRTQKEAQKKGYRLHLNSMGNESLITRARNTIVSQFLNQEPETNESIEEACKSSGRESDR